MEDRVQKETVGNERQAIIKEIVDDNFPYRWKILNFWIRKPSQSQEIESQRKLQETTESPRQKGLKISRTEKRVPVKKLQLTLTDDFSTANNGSQEIE